MRKPAEKARPRLAWSCAAILFGCTLACGPGSGSGNMPVRVLDIDNAVRLPERHRGKVVVFHLWASWCTPCKRELPDLVALQREYSREDVTFLLLSTDKRDSSLRRFLSGMDHDFEVFRILPWRRGQLTAAIDRLGGEYQDSIPYTAFLDRRGSVVYEFSGSSTQEDHRKIIDWALSQ
jgi:thiol-disulfide isomerase/thioredoxin